MTFRLRQNVSAALGVRGIDLVPYAQGDFFPPLTKPSTVYGAAEINPLAARHELAGDRLCA
jgi:hypothetical protein